MPKLVEQRDGVGSLVEAVSLLDALLAEQQMLQTPVVQFAQALSDTASLGTPSYRSLIPLTGPGVGEQYAFEVDLDACTGCKACVVACHSLNGLDENETWRDVGLVVSADPENPFAQSVTSACHHCADPACMNGCPVLAYEKDPITGVVRHLADQCIGCTYCVLKCPYDVPKFNRARGIVRKCDMCAGRLQAGEAPACAQACPTHAIRIVTVQTRIEAGVPRAETSAFLAAAPDPAYTQPTTRYVSRRQPIPVLVAANAGTPRVQPAHWPLVIMITCISFAEGCFCAAALFPWAGSRLIVMGWAAGFFGLTASVFHLGRPLRAWRVFLGLRRSWLSREAVLFGAWFAAASVCLGTQLFFKGVNAVVLIRIGAMIGGAGLFASAMVYIDTRRRFWRSAQTLPRFFGSAIVLGLAALMVVDLRRETAVGFILASLAKLGFEASSIGRDIDGGTAARETALLLGGPLHALVRWRRGLALVSIVLVLIWLPSLAIRGPIVCALCLSLAAEFLERALFFRAVSAPRMPGT